MKSCAKYLMYGVGGIVVLFILIAAIGTRGKYKKIVGIPHVMLSLEPMLHELVQRVHIHVGEELGSQVAERHSLFRALFEPAYDLREQPEDLPVIDPLSQKPEVGGSI